MRARQPIAIIDAITITVGGLMPDEHRDQPSRWAGGDIEPCPIFNSPPKQSGTRAGFLSPCGIARSSRISGTERAADASCVVLERGSGEGVGEKAWGARHDGARHALAELEAMTPRFSQWLPGEEIPEKHWMYRWAKRYWFNDFNAYREADHDQTRKQSGGSWRRADTVREIGRRVSDRGPSPRRRDMLSASPNSLRPAGGPGRPALEACTGGMISVFLCHLRMTWTQTYDPLGQVFFFDPGGGVAGGGVTRRDCLAEIRIHYAALLGLGVALVVALLVYRMPPSAAFFRHDLRRSLRDVSDRLDHIEPDFPL